jgi:hypothetical protein
MQLVEGCASELTHGDRFRLIWCLSRLTHLFAQQPVVVDREAEWVPAHTAVTQW